MIVRTGITSFYSRNNLPKFSFTEFKRIAHTCAISCGYNITGLLESGVTPNFHTAVLEDPDECFHLLGHSNFPIIAFAESREEFLCELRFRDHARITNYLCQMFPEVTIATLRELTRPIEKTDLKQLGRAEIEQLKYWKPRTIGELAFNWWD